MKKIFLIFFLLLPALGQAQEEDFSDDFLDDIFTEEESAPEEKRELPYSLYGYLVNYTALTGTDISIGNTLYGRLKGDWTPGENLSFHTEISLNFSTAGQNQAVFMRDFGFFQELYPTKDFLQVISVDHLWGRVLIGKGDLQFGKIPLAWGTGYLFNPSSRAAAPAFLETVSEETPGTIALQPSFSITDNLAFNGYVAFQEKTHKTTAYKSDGYPENLPLGIRIQAVLGSFDLSAGWIKEVIYCETIDPATGIILTQDYQKNYFASLDFAGAIWKFGVYGEGVYQLGENQEDPQKALEACAGFDYTIPLGDIILRSEYYYNGKGTLNTADYSLINILGGNFLQSRHYLFAGIERDFKEFYHITVGGMVNLGDNSFIFLEEFSWDIYDNFTISLGGLVPYGEEGTEFFGEYDTGIEVVDLMGPTGYLRGKLSF